jgi:hypothetical protein
VSEILLFPGEYLLSVVRSFRNRRAPGTDGIPLEILKFVVEINPRLLLDFLTAN